jgi:hypothetical protein
VTLEGANINQRRPGTLTYIALNGQNAQYITEQFVVKAGSTAKTLADLKGAKILSAPGPANLGAAKAVLKAVGLEEGKDYSIQEQQMGVHVGALQAGTFDAGYTLEPVASVMPSRTARAAWKPASSPPTCWAARRRWPSPPAARCRASSWPSNRPWPRATPPPGPRP